MHGIYSKRHSLVTQFSRCPIQLAVPADKRLSTTPPVDLTRYIRDETEALCWFSFQSRTFVVISLFLVGASLQR